ncbi:MAG: hypothetical protein AAFV53_16555 [Myxococcota bacterium]
MSLHPTARTDWARLRVLTFLDGLTLAGSPAVRDAEESGRNAEPTPWVRATFDELDPIWEGRASETQTAHRLRLLVTLDLFWPEQATDLGQIDQVASELRAALQYTSLPFLDYTDPAAPVAVGTSAIYFQSAVRIRRLAPVSGMRRRQVQAVGEWSARFNDRNAA